MSHNVCSKLLNEDVKQCRPCQLLYNNSGMSGCLISTQNKIVKFVRKVVLLLNECRDLAFLALLASSRHKLCEDSSDTILHYLGLAQLLIRNTSSLLGLIQADKLEDRAGNGQQDSHRLSSPSAATEHQSQYSTRFVLQRRFSWIS